MTFTVKTQTFEGPLDLLLDLIEKRKFFISDISLAKVTDDFITHIKQFENMPMGESAHFILVASTLLLIKSKSLLPELALSVEEQGDIRDLETRLKIYKRLKEAGRHVQELFGDKMIFGMSQSRPINPVFAPDPEFSLERALLTLKDLINRLPKKETLPQKVVRKVISLEDMISNLTKRITSTLKMSFKQFTSEHKGEKVNVIVSFLAMLELVKEGVLLVSQESNFADIQMETTEIGVPRY
ncbi:MAG: segregation/condensation protein A [Patescibacteria group bacterium]|nr:segregation/condensation protein A [Patescibacteria group bacterium]